MTDDTGPNGEPVYRPTTVDEAREALLAEFDREHRHTDAYLDFVDIINPKVDALIAAVRSEDETRWRHELGDAWGLRVLQAEQESAETLRALREALEEIRDLFNNDNIRPGTFAMRAGEIAVRALAARRGY